MYNLLGDAMFKKFYLFLIIFLSIFSFIFSFSKTQSFNNNIHVYPTDITSISSYFGYREIFGQQNFHNGIDFPAHQGSNIYSTLSGIVTYCSFLKGYGNTVIILNVDGTKALYGHMSEIFCVNLGDNIYQGQIIGHVGPKILSNGVQNGLTTGPHLHFSLFDKDGKAFDPLIFEYTKK
jgi:murein DD-endopeptidase MepM/ murein hydrolase activator NlpD